MERAQHTSVWEASSTGRPCSKCPGPTSLGERHTYPPTSPHTLRDFSDSPARIVSNSVEAKAWCPEQLGPGAAYSLQAPPASDPAPHPPHPESPAHHQDVSTRAGSVSSSSSSRQARPRRAEAREPSGAAGPGASAGTGARVRRGGSCAASSALPGFSIAPR